MWSITEVNLNSGLYYLFQSIAVFLANIFKKEKYVQ